MRIHIHMHIQREREREAKIGAEENISKYDINSQGENRISYKRWIEVKQSEKNDEKF